MKRVFVFSISFCFALFCFALSAKAVTNQEIIITWKAQNFYPASYSGKAFSTPKTPIAVSAVLYKNGKIVDLSGTQSEFFWYADGKMFAGGNGTDKGVFIANYGEDEYNFIRVRIKLDSATIKKWGLDPNVPEIEASLRIYLSSPLVVAEAPFYENFVDLAQEFTLKATPYFFNVTSLNELVFWWEVGGAVKTEQGNNTITIAGGKGSIFNNVLNVISTVQSAKDEIEIGKQTVRLKQLY